jgi:hypothetical protein
MLPALGALLVALVVLCVWLAVAVDNALRPMEWVRRCPVCRWELRRPYEDPWPHTCPNCGWVGY